MKSKILFFFKTKNISIFLVLIMILGFILRTYYLKQNNIVFGYDQARDAYIASQIIQGDLKILGPPVSLGGFYHGVLYYYFITLPYYISQGNPILPIFFLSLINLAAIPLVYLIGKNLFNSKIGLISALFYAISFDIIQYSNWLSNPSLAVPCSVLFYFGISLFLFKPQKNLGIFLTALGYGLCFQSQFFLGYLILPLFFLIYFYKIQPSKKQSLIFIGTTLVVISTMILSYFKFGFTFMRGFQNMFSNNDQFNPASADFSNIGKMVIVRLVENLHRNIMPFNSFYSFIFFVFCLCFFIKQIKKRTTLSKPLIFLWTFIFSQALIIPFGGNTTPHINVGLQIPIIIVSANFLIELSKSKKIISICLILLFSFFSLFTDIKLNKRGSLIFSIQKELTLKNEIESIEYTYQDANGEPFSINSITSPYWVNTLWSYLYQWYGQNKYKYTPYYYGRDQVGHLSYLTPISDKIEKYYLIIEPTNGIPNSLIKDSIAYEDSFSKIVETKNFDGILVQKRILTKPFNEINFIK